ncbi:MiaB/RimO family radical SAM methylthiotransferase, partial [Patescibacteria group bacterium]|nr:MiaB/RimO family radical SAM methylthiotransferase [Patescibacteria group bacterium]
YALEILLDLMSLTVFRNFCSYCAVPYTRGREWSRRPSTIIKEVGCLADKGYKKILLLGQNVNSYSIQVTKKGCGFVELLKRLVIIPGEFEVSFMSPHPKDFSYELIDLIAKEKKISKEIHLPMQSGDNKILQKMNRGYKANDYLALIQKMRRKIKDLRISTDIIVGFPGETEQKFRNTVRLIKSSRISKAYISIYSPRNGTLAQKKFADSVPQEIKKKRWLILEKMINKKTKR